jgi:hypothetical protein
MVNLDPGAPDDDVVFQKRLRRSLACARQGVPQPQQIARTMMHVGLQGKQTTRQLTAASHPTGGEDFAVISLVTPLTVSLR